MEDNGINEFTEGLVLVIDTVQVSGKCQQDKEQVSGDMALSLFREDDQLLLEIRAARIINGYPESHPLAVIKVSRLLETLGIKEDSKEIIERYFGKKGISVPSTH